jgi:hypothetical protein
MLPGCLMEENKPPDWHDRPTVSPCWIRMRQYLVPTSYRYRFPPPRNSLVKLNAGAPG